MSKRGEPVAARILVALAVAISLQACDAGETTEPGEAAEAVELGEEEEGLGSRSYSDPDKDHRPCDGTVKARVVAIDQPYTYNRFGAFNPIGEIYALERDVVPLDSSRPLGPGNARLRKDKRPRPLALRVNKGQCLEVIFTNLLAPDRNEIQPPPDVPFHAEPVTVGPNDAPFTRFASIHINGLNPLDITSDGANVGNNPSGLAAPGETVRYTWKADKEGTYLMHDMAAALGGEGLGGSIGLGLFGAVNVEPPRSVWFRSQVTSKELDAATRARNPDGTPIIDYDAVDGYGVPILRILDRNNEIVHGDINAIITGYRDTEVGTPVNEDQGFFREFVSLFHDELKVVQAFPQLANDPVLRSVRDAFGINYGSSAIGPMLLANRARIGPTRKCVECKFEEFFLSSWAGGDPAMNVEVDENGKAIRALYPDDPGNVHHAYVGDPVRFRNIHAGPKETHIFHLHSHQWLHEPGDDGSTYLDSEAIGPGSAFTYDITYGGGGNRNLTVGDAIYHCHLYPHFAQGMWALWRNHDVFESGTPDRNLPDGEIAGGTPNPAVVPIPERGMPPMPSYEPSWVRLASGKKVWRPALPGYPFFIAAIAGHRPSQPPLDMAFDGGLPRHVVTRTLEAEIGRRGEFDVEILRANLKLLPEDGTPDEKNAQAFHAGFLEGGFDKRTEYGFPAAAYPAFTPLGRKSVFYVNGQKPQPGAPYADPCPKGTKEREYHVAFVELDMLINGAGWHDPQARIMVLEQDVEDTLSGKRLPEPLNMRANSGECVVVQSSNLIPDVLQADDFQIFTPTDTMGQHVHLVKFDVTSSDGSANGWNYEDGTFAAEEVVARIEAANAAGGAFKADGTLDERGRRKLLRPERHPRIRSAPYGTQTTIQRWWADPVLNRKRNDRTLQQSFTHDHFSPSSHQQHGFYAALVVEPEGSIWRDPYTGERFGTRRDGGPTSFRADILVGPGGRDSFREFNVSVADFVLAYDAFDKPVNPQFAQEVALPIAIKQPEVPTPTAIAIADPGTMTVNYRNEPIPLRIAERKPNGEFEQRNGPEGDPAHVFDSNVHGDPFTHLLEAYQRDRVNIRTIEGAHEEMHSVSVHGVKWLHESGDADSGYTNAQGFGISQKFTFEFQLPPIDRRYDTADHLYGSIGDTDLWNGTWGLLRAYRRPQRHLLKLPNNRDFDDGIRVPSCPDKAPRRFYEVHAVLARDFLPEGRIVYNERFDLYDPDGILFVRKEHLPELTNGTRRAEPLVLRANAGDCIEVKLVNRLPEVLPQTPHWVFNPPITNKFNVNQVKPSNHVSLHPQMVQYEMNEGDGANVGLNREQTVEPGKSRTYRWYAGELLLKNGQSRRTHYASWRKGDAEFEARPIEFGIVNLRDFGDIVNHPMHGAVGALVIEPPGAKWQTDPTSEAQAVVHYKPVGKKGWASFREYVVVDQNDIPLHSDDPRFQCADPGLNCGTAIRNIQGADDAEDSGHKGFSYRIEPVWARFNLKPEFAVQLNDLELKDAFDSDVFGDPETPIYTAVVGQEVRFRLGMPSGHARHQAFTVHNAEWEHEPWVKNSTRQGFNGDSNIISTQGGFTVGRGFNILPINDAGGKGRVPGDYMYRDQSSLGWADGAWGIWRVLPYAAP